MLDELLASFRNVAMGNGTSHDRTVLFAGAMLLIGLATLFVVVAFIPQG